jgi:putative transcriptional regulator
MCGSILVCESHQAESGDAHFLLATLFLDEMAKRVFQIVYYRRGERVSGKQPRITNQIRTLRFLAGELMQQDLAGRIGVSCQTVNAIEVNKYSPSLEVSFRIAAVFAKPLEEVFQYGGEV